MDQHQQQEEAGGGPQAAGEGLPGGAEELQMEEDAVDGDEPMDESESDSDDNNDNDNYDWTSSYGSDSDESEEDFKYDRKLMNTLRYTIHQRSVKVLQMPIYNFRPLKLIKCNYKLRNAITDYPLARSGHRIVCTESHLFSLGGYNPRSALAAARRGQCLLFKELWSYNFAAGRWKLIINGFDNQSNMPNELASNAFELYQNVLISHGGTGYPFGETCSKDCYIYRAGEEPTVQRLNVSGELPTAQYGPSIVIHNDYLYTIGGTTGFEYSCDVFRLNLKTKVWESVYICRPDMRDDPEGRYRHEVIYDGHHIYILGGGTSHSVYSLNKLPAFNLETNGWDYFDTYPDRSLLQYPTTSDDMGYPKARKCFTCVQHKNSNGDIEAFITGGLQGDFTTYFSDIWKLSLRTREWTLLRGASLPKPLYFHSAAHAGNGCMYIFGGIEYSEKSMRRRNDLHKMWLTIPKLTEMCWDALTYYNQNLNVHSRDSLIRAGIPRSFLERLPMPRVRKHHLDTHQNVSSIATKRIRSQSQ